MTVRVVIEGGDAMAAEPVASGQARDTTRHLLATIAGLLAPDPTRSSLYALGDYLSAPAPKLLVAVAIGVICAVLSILLRFAATAYIGDGEALLTAFPLVLVASLTSGALAGWVTLVICTFASWYLFIGDSFSFSFGPYEKGILIGTFLAGAFTIQICVLMRRTFREIAALRATEDLLSRELEHRMKNTLTLVLSIGRQTFKRDRTIESAFDDFESRIVALAAAQDLVGKAESTPASIASIVERSLTPFCGIALQDRLVLEGPEVFVGYDVTVALFLVFHELATNAAKYGSLSVAEGVIAVAWRLEENGHRLVLGWTETRGPTIASPTRQGFGSKLLHRIVARNLEGRISIDYASTGLQAELTLPLES